MSADIYYRVMGRSYSNYDADSDTSGPPHQEVRLLQFKVIRRTPKGAWIKADSDFGGMQFVKTGTKKCFARPTKAEAYTDFYAIKKRHISILQAQIAKAQRYIALAQLQQTTKYDALIGVPKSDRLVAGQVNAGETA